MNPDASKPQLSKFQFFLILLAACLFTFATSFLITTRLLRRVTVVQVPDITNKSVESARSILRVLRLEMELGEFRFDNRIPLNYILAQDPKAGENVKSGRVVRVMISRGAQYIKTPNLIGQNIRQASLLLGERTLTPGRVTRFYSKDFSKDAIADQFPAPEKALSRGGNVQMLVSQGARPIWFSMPSLRGKTLEQASAALHSLGLELREIKRKPDPGQPAETVLTQSPAAGMRARVGDSVGLVASLRTGENSPSARLVAIHYRIPPGRMEVRVKLVIRDETGLREIYNAMEKPDSELSLRQPVQGKNAGLQIFVNGVLVEESTL